MNLKFLFIAILIVMLTIPSMDTQIFSIALAQSSQDLDPNIGNNENETKLISNTTGDQKDEDDNIISSSELPNRDILSFINNTTVDSTVTETAAEEEGEEGEEQTAVTDELTTEGGRNVTKTETQNKEDEGKTITIEELPMRSKESQNEGATEGNVTIKGLHNVNNTSDDSDLTTSSELNDQPEQETQTPFSKETIQDVTKKENKIKILEICNDEIDNDLDGIIDEEYECNNK